MLRRSLRTWVLPSLVLTFGASGCNLLLGISEFADQQPAGTGAGGAGGVEATTSSGGGSAGSTSSGGAGGVGGSGGGVCAPGETVECDYSGPAGTQGVGLCKAGTKTCAMDGSGYGPCSGEVLPATENCQVQGDEDCDDVACSDTLWSTIFNGPGEQKPSSAVIDGQGNILVAGSFYGTMSLGNVPSLISAGMNDYFLAKFDSTGKALWARQFGDATDNGELVRVAVDAKDNIYIAGELAGGADFGGGLFTSSGKTDAFVAAFDASGAHQWSKHFGDATTQRSNGLCVDAQGNVVVVGAFQGSVNFGGGSFTSLGNTFDAFVVKFAADGKHLYSSRFKESPGNPATYQEAIGVAADPSGNIAVVGRFSGEINFGTASLTGGGDFVARFDSFGNHSWSKPISSGLDNAIAMDSNGSVIIAAGSSTDTATLDGTILPGQGSIYVAKLNALGSAQWGQVVGGKPAGLGGMTVDGEGNVLLTGRSSESLDLGNGSLNHVGDIDFFIAKFGPGGGPSIWSKMFGGVGQDEGAAVAVAPSGTSIVVAGMTTNIIDFGTGPLTSFDGGYDMFLTAFQP